MKIVVPMAGRGTRFADAGITLPKPLIEIRGRPMVAWALDSLKNIPRTDLIFIALREHESKYGVVQRLKTLGGEAVKIILIPDVTEGQLCTVLAAKEFINTKEALLIASSDTYCVSSLENDIANRANDCRGIISVADLPGDRWSFARTDETGRVVEVAEKVRISNHASTGLYYFSSGREFVALGEEMIHNREKTRGEYYVIPVYQKYVQRGWRVEISVAQEMWDMGTPASLEQFKKYINA